MGWGSWGTISRGTISGGLDGRSGSGSGNPSLRSSSGQLLDQPLALNSCNTNGVRIVFRLPSQLSDQLGISRSLFPQLLDHSN